MPGKLHGWRSLVGYSLRDRKESDTTERLHWSIHCGKLDHFRKTQTANREQPLTHHDKLPPQILQVIASCERELGRAEDGASTQQHNSDPSKKVRKEKKSKGSFGKTKAGYPRSCQPPMTSTYPAPHQPWNKLLPPSVMPLTYPPITDSFIQLSIYSYIHLFIIIHLAADYLSSSEIRLGS